MINDETSASKDATYELESARPFSQSLIWDLNRAYYHNHGIDAWGQGLVPHQVTSNSKVGKTYAEIIFGFLKDLAFKGHVTETVYVLELGAGHGRLAYHTIKHLEKLTQQIQVQLPPYCYILSDIAEKNLEFFSSHHQLQQYFSDGRLDVAYFDMVESDTIALRKSGKVIHRNELNQPLLVLANYLFDSIPIELFHVHEGRMSNIALSLNSSVDPQQVTVEELLKNISLEYHADLQTTPYYDEPILNDILSSYKQLLNHSFVLFPVTSLRALENLKDLSTKGTVILTMDKGHHLIHDLEHTAAPVMQTHGSISFNVNFNALGQHCERLGGKAWFPARSTFNLTAGCLLYIEDVDSYTDAKLAYQRYVDDFGPDELISLKKYSFKHYLELTIDELLGFMRLSAYDSTVFLKLLPSLKQSLSTITYNERYRVEQTLNEVWDMYFNITEPEDIAFEIGGVLYQLAYYKEALTYFTKSEYLFGVTPDVYYNRILCYYQLRQDELFINTLRDAKAAFPSFKNFDQLSKLDLTAK